MSSTYCFLRGRPCRFWKARDNRGSGSTSTHVDVLDVRERDRKEGRIQQFLEDLQQAPEKTGNQLLVEVRVPARQPMHEHDIVEVVTVVDDRFRQRKPIDRALRIEVQLRGPDRTNDLAAIPRHVHRAEDDPPRFDGWGCAPRQQRTATGRRRDFGVVEVDSREVHTPLDCVDGVGYAAEVDKRLAERRHGRSDQHV